jgi:peptidoglycan/LPS O-acetylase OafA/YrhL
MSEVLDELGDRHAPKAVRYEFAEPAEFEASTELPELSGLRGIAIVIVFAGHVAQRVQRFHGAGISDGLSPLWPHLTSPAAGVFMFFVISGFLIAERIARQHVAETSWFVAFYWRRFTRIALPYYVVLVATFVATGALSLQPRKVNLFAFVPTSLLDSLIASLAFVHYAVWGTFPRLFPPGWTNEVEIQFYLAAPLLCLGYLRIQNARWRGWLGAPILLVSLALSWFTMEMAPTQFRYSLLVYLPYFWLGIVLSDLKRERRLPRLHSAWGWASLFAFVVGQPYFGSHVSELLQRCVLLTLILCSTFARAGSLPEVSKCPAFVALGRFSFSIYLVHLQVVHVVTDLTYARLRPRTPTQGLVLVLLIATPLVIAMAYTFHQLIERPSMRIGKPPFPRRARREPVVS